MKKLSLLLLLSCLFLGCATNQQTASRNICGPIVAQITSTPSGARIEIDDNYIGKTPLTTTIKRQCTQFGWAEHVIFINALPTNPGQYVQRKIIGLDQQIPTNIYFEMNLVPIKY